MECLSCGRSAPADPETGYQGDPLCPSCTSDGWTILSDGTLLSPEDLDAAHAIVTRVQRIVTRARRRMLRAEPRPRSLRRVK